MAEAAAIASIVGIAGFGIQLTKVLYDFGSNVSCAREQTGYIARQVDLYANVLDILTERIDDEEPILSDAAFDLIDELKYQSNDLFAKIEKLLPIPKEGKDEISFIQKVKWNFTQSRVALLVGELDYLRSTVHLLVTIIFTGRKIRSRRKRKATSSKDSTSDVDNDLQKQGLKAQNALLAHHDALENLPKLEKEAERQEISSITKTHQPHLQEPNTRTDVICGTTTAIVELQQSLAVYTDPTERQKVVLQRSVHVLQQLLQQWTTVDLSAPTSTAERQQTETAVRQQPASSPKESERSTKTPPPTLPNLRPAGSHEPEPESTRGHRTSETRRMPIPGQPQFPVPSIYVKDWQDTLQDGAETSRADTPPSNRPKLTNHASDEQEHQAAMRRQMESEQYDIEALRRKHELQMAMEDRQEALKAARREAERRQLEAHREKLSNIEMIRKSGVSPTEHAGSAPPSVVEKAEANRNDAKTVSDTSLPERALHTKGNDPISPVLPGWTSHWDAKAGRFYYYDRATRKTQWEDPYAFRKPARSASSQFERSEKTPVLERKSTPYATTAGERTIVGEGSRPSVPPSPAIKSARSTKPQVEDIFAQFFSGFADGGGSSSKTPGTLAPCRACNGRGGREAKAETCQMCSGCGEVTVTRHFSGGHRRSVQRECRDCNGTGHLIPLRYQCKVCLGTKKELLPTGSGAQFVYGKGGEDEPGSERMQCASQ